MEEMILRCWERTAMCMRHMPELQEVTLSLLDASERRLRRRDESTLDAEWADLIERMESVLVQAHVPPS